jgi:hypothetical protein
MGQDKDKDKDKDKDNDNDKDTDTDTDMDTWTWFVPDTWVAIVRYHCGGWPEEVNTCFLNSYMVYL